MNSKSIFYSDQTLIFLAMYLQIPYLFSEASDLLTFNKFSVISNQGIYDHLSTVRLAAKGFIA